MTILTHLQDDSRQEVQFKERSRNRGETECVTLEVVVLAASQSHQDPLWALAPGNGTGRLGDKDTRLSLGRKPARDRIAGHCRSRP